MLNLKMFVYSGKYSKISFEQSEYFSITFYFILIDIKQIY